MPSQTPPISAKVAIERPPNVTVQVMQLNDSLERPWSRKEIRDGRWIDALSCGPAEREELFRLFREQGWRIETKPTPRNETIWVFRPGVTVGE
jgi:hypothetical protein